MGTNNNIKQHNIITIHNRLSAILKKGKKRDNMAIRKITQFEGDSWKKQEEESDRAHHYFKIYKKKQLSLQKYKQFLMKEADERHCKGRVKFWNSDITFNKKNQKEIQLYVDTEGKKGQCPKPVGTIDDWFEYHKWTTRRREYWQFQEEEADEQIRAMIRKRKPKIAKNLLECIDNTINARKQQYEEGRLSLSQNESGANAISKDFDSLNKLCNNDTQKIEATVNADVNANVNVKRNLSADLISNPKYAELTRKLREDVLNGRTDSSDTR